MPLLEASTRPSRYVIARDSVLPGLPGHGATLVLQATNAGARRPGYEARSANAHILTYLSCLKWQSTPELDMQRIEALWLLQVGIPMHLVIA